MKTIKTLATTLATAVALSTLLVGCKQMPLEEQIAVKEPYSWDFKVIMRDGSTRILRIYDGPDKLGYFVYEYGHKNPCNQGFQKTIKTTAPGVVRYVNDSASKSYACYETIGFYFITDEKGHPLKGWNYLVKDDSGEKLPNLAKQIAALIKRGDKPSYTLVN